MFKILLYSTAVLLIACNRNSKLDCSDQNTDEISVLSDSISIKFPSTWAKIDSTYFYDKAKIYTRRIMSNDTSDFVLISVSDYSVYSGVQINSIDFFASMKAKMKEFNNGKDNLIEDVSKEINGHIINFLKYVQVGDKNKVYDGHIGFILPGKKQVEIQIRANSNDGEKMIDCIFASLKVK